VSRPEDESSTELAWREIVEHYGERAVLDEPETADPATADPATAEADEDVRPPATDPVATATPARDFTAELSDDLLDDDPVEERERASREAERFRPPPAPPFPVPRTWQRGVAWAGIFLAPILALVIAVSGIYVNPLIGWLLVLWFVGGFLFLVFEMPRSPRDPWDDGSRV
jgi:hypothetical protein